MDRVGKHTERDVLIRPGKPVKVLLNTISSAKDKEKARLEGMKEQRNTKTDGTLLLGTSFLWISKLRIGFVLFCFLKWGIR